MTLEEMHNKIKEYESKWGKLGHTNIMKPEKYTIEHSGLSKGETKMLNMTNDFYAFRRKVAEGKEKNKIAHTATINITDLNKRYFEQITTDGTLIHSNVPYGQGYYQKIEKFYPDGSTRYFYTPQEWEAYQKEKGQDAYRKQQQATTNANTAKTTSGSAKSQNDIEAQKRYEYEQNKKEQKKNLEKDAREHNLDYYSHDNHLYRKQSDGSYKDTGTTWDETRKQAIASGDNKIEKAMKEGGMKAAIDALKKDERYEEFLNQIEGGFQNGDYSLNKDGKITGINSKEDREYAQKMTDWFKQFKDSNGVSIYYNKSFQDELSKEIKDRWDAIQKANPKFRSQANEEANKEAEERNKYEAKKAKLDANRAKNEAAAKAKSEEEENKSKASIARTKNELAALAEEEREKNKGVTSQTGKSAPKVRDDSDFKKNSGISSGMSWGKNNKPLTDEEIDELEEAGKPSAGALSRQASKEKHKENVDKRNAELEDRKSEREKEIADKKATTKNAHKENPEDYVKQMPKTTNPKNTKEEIVAPKKTSDNNKSLTIAERDELLKDASNNRVSVSELASKYGISEEEVEKLISGVLGGGFKHSAINEEDSVMSEYRAFKKRANEGAKRNRLSHSAVISPADLNAKYYQDIEDHCFLVHASNNYGKQHYTKIENYYPDGSTRYFWSKEEWDAYQRNKGQDAYRKQQKANKNAEAAKTTSGGAKSQDNIEAQKRYAYDAQKRNSTASNSNLSAKITEAYNKNKAAEEPYKREALDPSYREMKNKIRIAYNKNKEAAKHEGDRWLNVGSDSGSKPSEIITTVEPKEKTYVELNGERINNEWNKAAEEQHELSRKIDKKYGFDKAETKEDVVKCWGKLAKDMYDHAEANDVPNPDNCIINAWANDESAGFNVSIPEFDQWVNEYQKEIDKIFEDAYNAKTFDEKKALGEQWEEMCKERDLKTLDARTKTQKFVNELYKKCLE